MQKASAFSPAFIINYPAAIIKAVVVAGGGNKDYLCRIFGVVFKNTGFPLKGFCAGLRVGEVVLLVGRCIKGDFVAAFFEFEVYCHAATEKISVLVVSDDVGGAEPFVGSGDAAGIIGDVFAFFILNAEETADVVKDFDIVRPVDNQRGFVVASRQVFCGVDEVVV